MLDQSREGGRGEITLAQTRHRRFAGSTDAPEGYAGHEVLDPTGNSMGSAEEVFFNANGEPEYVRVRTGLVFKRAVPVPVQDVALDPAARSLKPT